MDPEKVTCQTRGDRAAATQSWTAFVTPTAILLSWGHVLEGMLKEVVEGGTQKPCRTFGTTSITATCGLSNLDLGASCSCSVRILVYSWAWLLILGWLYCRLQLFKVSLKNNHWTWTDDMCWTGLIGPEEERPPVSEEAFWLQTQRPSFSWCCSLATHETKNDIWGAYLTYLQILLQTYFQQSPEMIDGWVYHLHLLFRSLNSSVTRVIWTI